MTDLDLEHVPGRLELSAPAEPAIIDLVHALIAQLWTGHPDVGDEDRMLFEMAVVEILGNVVEHAYAQDPHDGTEQRRFAVLLAVTGQDLLAAFSDNGVPAALDLGDVAMPGEHAESGRGLALASAALDDLDYRRAEGRNHWRLRRTRRSG